MKRKTENRLLATAYLIVVLLFTGVIAGVAAITSTLLWTKIRMKLSARKPNKKFEEYANASR